MIFVGMLKTGYLWHLIEVFNYSITIIYYTYGFFYGLHKGYFETPEIGNNANIGIKDFTTWKPKIPVTKCYPTEYWTLEPLNPLI